MSLICKPNPKGGRLFIAIPIVGLAVFAWSSLAQPADRIREGLIRISLTNDGHYGVLQARGDIGHEAVPLTYFVRWTAPNDYRDYQLIDSQFAIGLSFCDTNAVVFALASEDSSYLVVERLSPRVLLDTLAAYENTAGNNWLPRLSEFAFSSRDSLVAGDFRFADSDDAVSMPEQMEVMQISRGHGMGHLTRVVGAYSCSVSRDFSQFLFGVRTCGPRAFDTLRLVALYDISDDTLMWVDYLPAGLKSPERRERAGPLYCLCIDGISVNIVKRAVDSTWTFVTDLVPPERVESFQLLQDRIRVFVSPGDFDQRGRIFFVDE